MTNEYAAIDLPEEPAPGAPLVTLAEMVRNNDSQLANLKGIIDGLITRMNKLNNTMIRLQEDRIPNLVAQLDEQSRAIQDIDKRVMQSPDVDELITRMNNIDTKVVRLTDGIAPFLHSQIVTDGQTAFQHVINHDIPTLTRRINELSAKLDEHSQMLQAINAYIADADADADAEKIDEVGVTDTFTNIAPNGYMIDWHKLRKAITLGAQVQARLRRSGYVNGGDFVEAMLAHADDDLRVEIEAVAYRTLYQMTRED